MAVITTVLTSNLQKPVDVIALKGVFFTGDSNANVIAVDVYDGESPASLSGSVKGYVILPDHSTLPAISGTLSGNRASITLPADAYVLEGAIDIVVKLESGSGTSAVKTALGACHGYVARTTTNTAYDPGSVVPSIEDLEYWIEQCQVASGAANTAATKLNNMDATATSLAADATPTATVSTVSGHYRLNFGIPVGVPPDFSIGTVQSGATAAVTMTGTATDPVLNFVLPKGDKGDKGNTGATGAAGTTPAFSIGTVTKGNNASATITGTTANPVLNLVLPKGDPGAAGTPGAAGSTPALSIGTVTTGAAGTNASVTISGTNEAPVLNFTIPRGAKGNAGNVSSVNGVSPDANGNVTIGMGDIDTGTIPVNKGGTGATTAANALTNLGAVAKAGDTMTGQLYAPNVSAQASSSSAYPRLYIRDVAGNQCISFLQTSSGNGRLRIREMTDPANTSDYEDYRLPMPSVTGGNSTYEILTTKTADSATASAARTALGITPENIGALKYTVLSSGYNLNDLKTAGLYYASGNPLNAPNSATNGFVLVIGDATRTKQEWFRYGTIGTNDHQTYVRTFSTDTWSNWYQVITSMGGSITGGNLYITGETYPAYVLRLDGDTTNISAYMIYGNTYQTVFRERHPSASSYFESYALPAPDSSRTSSTSYQILTTKTYNPIYAAGDTFTTLTSASYRPIWSGTVSSDRKSIYLCVTVDASLENISSIAVTTLTGWIYGIAGAIESSTTSTAWVSNYTVTALKASKHIVRIQIKKTNSTVFSGVTESTPVVASLNTVLTFS